MFWVLGVQPRFFLHSGPQLTEGDELQKEVPQKRNPHIGTHTTTHRPEIVAGGAIWEHVCALEAKAYLILHSEETGSRWSSYHWNASLPWEINYETLQAVIESRHYAPVINGNWRNVSILQLSLIFSWQLPPSTFSSKTSYLFITLSQFLSPWRSGLNQE